MKAGVAALMAVASLALAVPEAKAHDVHAQVVIGSPVAVFGFSYGDPFAVGHVHYGPVACSHGPLYYYPAYGVYGHYYPRYRYVRYASPHYFRPYHGHGPYKVYRSYGHGGHYGGHYDGRHDGHGGGYGGRGSNSYKVRGHRH
jgi:hypothetical protein